MQRWTWLAVSCLVVSGCGTETGDAGGRATDSYLDYSGRVDVLSGGARWIPVEAGAETYNVWVKRVGSDPSRRVLLLHGGPGATHEYLEAFDSYFPEAAIEYYYYDQLGSHFSDQPDDPALWNVDRFVDEVEQVRRQLRLGPDDFYLYGHSWGGILAIEYALKYPENLKGLIISNMMSSVPAYNAYAEEVLKPAMDPEALAELEAFEAAGDFENPRYVELLMEQHYVHHVLRMPLDEWPEPVQRSFANINPDVYVLMQGPSELGLRGTLEGWDRSGDLARIRTPTLVIGSRYDTMDPAHMEWMASQLPNGRHLYCPDGSHMAMYDDQKTYFRGLVDFIQSVDAGH